MNRVYPSYLLIVICMFPALAYGQFSPGELSRPHQNLEGTNNCTSCHEIGNEISGKKCLTCHTEIQFLLEKKRGFHFTSVSNPCVSCHKEHLGKDAKTMIFNPKTFDHSKTGFMLHGKHSSVQCNECHRPKNIKDTEIFNVAINSSRQSYIGLTEQCSSCHEDIHNKKFQNECNSCHNESQWAPAPGFKHASTKFKLEGKHSAVKCSRCHITFAQTPRPRPFIFTTKNFADCTPCHSSPHGTKFAGQQCSSCHSPEQWNKTSQKKFDHNLTDFKLTGAHTSIRCEQCHGGIKGKPRRLTMKHSCNDCHNDKHNGEFKAAYNNNCASCHNDSHFTPSTFGLTMHAKTKFPLTGSHIATLCSQCHKKTKTESLTFHLENFECESCHSNPHKQNFSSAIKLNGCRGCHSPSQWKAVLFDHAKTAFALTGKHLDLRCTECHHQSEPADTLNNRCATCHTDIHHQQFAVNSVTECNTCHNSSGWKALLFNHETQSAFSLRGGHSRVECSQCHKKETVNNTTFVRYKPLSTGCKSCHDGKENK